MAGKRVSRRPAENVSKAPRHVAADHDGARVEHGDGGGQRLADAATRLAHDRPRLAVAVHRLGDEVAHVVHVLATRPESLDERPAARDRLQAAGVAAAAQQALGGRDLDMAQLARGATVTPDEPAAGHDAEPEPGRGLEDEHVIVLSQVAVALGGGHHVAVVVEDQRCAGDVLEVCPERYAVPAGHGRASPR